MNTKDIIFHCVKYKRKHVWIGFYRSDSFSWYVGEFNNNYVLIFNTNLDIKLRSKLLHKLINNITK